MSAFGLPKCPREITHQGVVLLHTRPCDCCDTNLPPPTAANSYTTHAGLTDHCPACGSKHMAECRPVVARRPGPKGAGRGTRRLCDHRWHLGAAR